MLKIVISLLLFVVITESRAQVSTGLAATADVVSSVYLGGGEYEATVDNFRSSVSLYDQFDISVGDLFWTETSIPTEPCFQYEILSITYETNGLITFILRGNGLIGSSKRPKINSVAAILSKSPNINLSLFKASQSNLIGYISANLQECVMNDVILNIDNIGSERLDSVYVTQQGTFAIFNFVYADNTVQTDTISLDITVNGATVSSDQVTILGDGSGADQLRVDTINAIATKSDLITFSKNLYIYNFFIGGGMLLGGNSVVVPNLPSLESQFFVTRNGLRYNTNNFLSFTGNQIFFNDYNFQANETVTVYVYR